MNTISVVIPVYNEEKGIKGTLEILQNLRRQYPDIIEIIVVNDGSVDRSGEILSTETGIKLLTNGYNIGYGSSLKRGIKAASGDWIFIADADGTYPVERLPDFFSFMADYDMIVGVRTTAVNHIPVLRRPAKKFLNWFAGWIVNFPIPDLNSGMRLFRRRECLEFWGLYPERFSFTSTITLAFIRSHYLVKYVPIDYHKRLGSSSLSPWNFFTFLGLVFRIAFYFNPLRFLLPFVLLLISTGVIKGVYDLAYSNAIGNFSILLVTIGCFVLLLALLSDLLFRQRSK
ncbi:MAG: hypothetical protein A2571_01440 [Candidatus Vogelbacteria bacterium RIFOXYD1_FULL_44_32]|uniref:Glycosyltransferase 2-like domain-containing protein n=1 Tax=Candidatus Vogelbacteria bacterium RIFOXYD1_FULL_44_32 TaxID=1802438 RepID=A0A1G2QCW8_9BACT|nr:MAG: hypothetical protein A2571_01440 [Candidatus Vogelbacteria bacterium RIFOXYD1_FULL_44_32]